MVEKPGWSFRNPVAQQDGGKRDDAADQADPAPGHACPQDVDQGDP